MWDMAEMDGIGQFRRNPVYRFKLPSGTEIGNGQRPFIVAEVGSNWANLDDCIKSIHHAKACGADAVKFQLYRPDALYGFEHEDEYWRLRSGPREMGYCAVSDSRFEAIRQSSLPLGWLPVLKEKADRAGIEFMCTAFSPELLEAVNPYVNLHKIASAELTHVRMLEKIAQFGKPVSLSTGASGAQDVRLALSVLGATPTVLMYCVAAYPARRVNLYAIDVMRAEFNRLVGYSDHTTDVLMIPRMAAEHQACMIEKHVNFAGVKGTPDAPHSLSTEEFQTMVRAVRGELTTHVMPGPEEMPMMLRHNRRLIVTRPVAEGDRLIEGDNFGIFRALEDDIVALPPWAIDRVNGQKAKRSIKAGQGIGPGDV